MKLSFQTKHRNRHYRVDIIHDGSDEAKRFINSLCGVIIRESEDGTRVTIMMPNEEFFETRNKDLGKHGIQYFHKWGTI